jgi:hypothetical protein
MEKFAQLNGIQANQRLIQPSQVNTGKTFIQSNELSILRSIHINKYLKSPFKNFYLFILIKN